MAARVKQTVPKYQLDYGSNGEVFYAGANVGNYFTSNIFEVGPDAWLENTAKEQGIQLSPSQDWLSINGQAGNTQGRLPVRVGNGVDDVAEKSLQKTFSVKPEQRSGDASTGNLLGGLSTVNPINTYTATRGMGSQQDITSDKSEYGKGFSPKELNPYFRGK